MGKAFKSSKTYTHSTGHTCAFRQWRAEDHCRWIHGYALEFELTFRAKELDEKYWVVGFGDLKELKAWLKWQFDHTLCIAKDDPHLEEFKRLAEQDICDLRVLDRVGCESFAELVFDKASDIIKNIYGDRCWVEKVTVREHGSNSATCQLA